MTINKFNGICLRLSKYLKKSKTLVLEKNRKQVEFVLDWRTSLVLKIIEDGTCSVSFEYGIKYRSMFWDVWDIQVDTRTHPSKRGIILWILSADGTRKGSIDILCRRKDLWIIERSINAL